MLDEYSGGRRNKLLQFGVEPSALIPIYTVMQNMVTSREYDLQTDAILNFLADSRRYLAG